MKPNVRVESPDRKSSVIPGYLLDDDNHSTEIDEDSIHLTTKLAADASNDIKIQEPIQQLVLPKFINILLKANPLPKMSYHLCRTEYETNDEDAMKKIDTIKHLFHRSDEICDVQRKLWPHIMEKRSAMLVCDFEGLPQTMYLKPFCWLINVSRLAFFLVVYFCPNTLHAAMW